MALRLFDRTSIYFRFASEGNAVEKVEFHGREIAVGDLKQAIAEKKNLPKFDLVLVNEATNEVYERDGKMLPKNMIVTVRRNPLHNSKKPAVLKVENFDIWSTLKEAKKPLLALEERPAIKRSACPPEYLCGLCNDIFRDAHIARCCGRSACAVCFERRKDCCPLCTRAWEPDTTPIPNPRLADSVAALDLDYFILPKCAKKEEDISDAGTTASSPQSDPDSGHAPEVGLAAAAPLAHQQPPRVYHGRPPPLLPAGFTLRKEMLSQEQFHAWQASLRSRSSSSSRNDRRKRRKSKGKKDSGKKRRRH